MGKIETDKLSEPGYKEVKAKINQIWPKIQEDRNDTDWSYRQTLELSKAATKVKLKPFLNFWDKDDIEKLCDESRYNQLIDSKCLGKIYAKEPLVATGEKTLNPRIINILIEDRTIIAVGLSEATCAKFRAGKQKIDTLAFQLLCETLGLDYNRVVYREQNDSNQNQQEKDFDRAFSQLDHTDQWSQFITEIGKCRNCGHFFIEDKSTASTSHVKLLLDCLKENLINTRRREIFTVHLEVELSQKNIDPNNLDLLWNKLATKIKKKVKLKVKKQTVNVEKQTKHNPSEIATAVSQILAQEDLIIAIPDQGEKNNTRIISEMWNLLLNIAEADRREGLFLCFYGKNQPENPSSMTILETLSVFERSHLDRWLDEKSTTALLPALQKSKADELWQESQGDVDRLITTLYQRFVDNETQGVPESWTKIG